MLEVERPAMRHLIAKIIIATVMGLVLLGGAYAASVPAVRHIASGWWNSPERMTALPEDPLVHYQDGTVEYARTVAGLLPTAIARVEAVHGRQFGHPVTLGVYASREAFIAANGTGSPGPVGVMFLGSVRLSPVLFSNQRQRLPAILTHELSHAHIATWITGLAYLRLPHWFTEGLGVMVSGGGGAEGVTELQAREAIRRGDHIAVESAGSLLNLTGIKFEHPVESSNASFRTLLAYRQGGLFVAFLHDTDPAGFARMMNAILDGKPFAEAVMTGYQTDLQTLWLRFAQGA
jgi:hypothetical protein